MGKFLGVYDYTVILTYMSLISSLLGITQAFSGHFPAAIICLAVSGLCDGFDGRVARVKKNRTEDEKAFGIQLDSLCDVVCFGVYPALLCYNMGMNGVLGLIIVCFFSLCAVIRLAFFNVLEGKRQQTEGGSTKSYHGLPVTSIAFILPLVYVFNFFIDPQAFKILLHVAMTATGFLYILDFPLRKPSLKTLLIMIAVAVAIVGSIFIIKL